jgi:hypothetical protein
MNCEKMKFLIGLVLILAGTLLCQGCAANGYITASVQSVIGLDVSENPQTQVPHIRFGYIRNQLYYIPTGKVVVSGGPAGSSGKASETPELVSDIDVDITFLSKTKISERFAVGENAVKSNAAQYLFVPSVEAAKKFAPMEIDQELRTLVLEIAKITKDKTKRTIAEKWIEQHYPEFKGEEYILTKFLMHPPSKTALELLLNELKKT